MSEPTTHWGKVSKWYDHLVGEQGHYYHDHVIFPNLKLISLPRKDDHVLDVGCGQGVYARILPKGVNYTGIDASTELIKTAAKHDPDPTHTYLVADVTKAIPSPSDTYDLTLSILALQNMADARSAIQEMARVTKRGGTIILVLNHPAFRIPRQSSWGIDAVSKQQYRRLNLYLSSLEIPINAHPGKAHGPVTWSYHHPISYYTSALTASDCALTGLYEWVSDKASQGSARKMENRARAEFPLFLCLKAKKNEI